MIAAEGAACLNFLAVKRSVVEDKPAPSGGFQNRQLLIGQTVRPLSAKVGLRRLRHRLAAGPHGKLRITDAFGEDHLAGRADVAEIVYGFHVVEEHRIISAGEPLHQLGYLRTCPDLLREREPVVAAAVVGKAEHVL